MMRRPLYLVFSLTLVAVFGIWDSVADAAPASLAIIEPQAAAPSERLAARELRRYLYLRTGELVSIEAVGGERPAGTCIVIGQKDQPVIGALVKSAAKLAESVQSLQPQQYLLKTIPLASSEGKTVLLVAGGDPVGTLYGAYRLAEHWGIRFYLHGDVVPDGRMVLALPRLDERGAPLFQTRGIQPFHDFPEGPDWWSTDDYKAIIAQLPKLRMNFLGLHTYPQGGVGPEPTVWIGLKEDVNPDGTVRLSSPSSYQNTLRGNWGYTAQKTSDFSYGTAQLFERDDYGPEVMYGAMPVPQTPADRNTVFNRTGRMLKEAFEFAHTLGVQTCVGTETPLTIPDVVKQRLQDLGKNRDDIAAVRELYEGMFQRIAQAYPVDYYWFWTPESWTWGNPKEREIQATLDDLQAAIEAARNVKPPFVLATCGWVLGPPKDRALFNNVLPREMPMSCINRSVGFTPVETGFARVQGRPQWAIPWLEDDPALLVPQLWVGRMRRDAADALAYGCTGLLGIHWRTRILGPNVSALAKAAWDQKPWNPYLGQEIVIPDPKTTEGREGGTAAAFPNNAMADTEQDALYQTVTYDMKAYRLKVPNGAYTVRLQFCEPHYADAGKRVFGVTLQGRKAIDTLDVFATVGRNRALDYTFPGVEVANGLLEIQFDSAVEFPCVAAFVVEGKNFTRKINCGGPACAGYEADLPGAFVDDRPRDLPTEDFYVDWARTEFGREVAEPVAQLFARLDGGPDVGIGKRRGDYLPRPSTWVGGPGGIQPDGRPWDQVEPEYAFVDDLAALRSGVRGAGQLERFDYWLNTMRYLRTVGQINCTWGRFNAAWEKLKREPDREKQKQLARETLVPIRKELVRQVGQAHDLLLATITTTGGMGTVANWQQHALPSLLTEPGKRLAELLGEPLSAEAMPGDSYTGPPRLIVPTVRASLTAGEDLRLKVILVEPALDLIKRRASPHEKPAGILALQWRPLGADTFETVPVEHVARGVYSVRVSAAQIAGHDIEYYVQASVGADTIRFPATAPALNQTVVWMQDN
ncbi:MAG: malectin domain-containing carbohydrate-binding protein [Planctomycetes bacterium]|nr:malectin domain-containing carbohydrate-binding protein [Planctomycetota bacterium]